MMGEIFALRRLRWKLTLSYTLVAAVTLLALELILAGALVAFITEARGAELQGRSGAASRETLEPESAGHRSYTREARGLRRQFRSAGGQQAPARKPEQLRGGSGCPTRGRRQASPAGLRP